MEFGILGPLEVTHSGQPVPVAGSRERAVLLMRSPGIHRHNLPAALTAIPLDEGVSLADVACAPLPADRVREGALI